MKVQKLKVCFSVIPTYHITFSQHQNIKFLFVIFYHYRHLVDKTSANMKQLAFCFNCFASTTTIAKLTTGAHTFLHASKPN